MGLENQLQQRIQGQVSTDEAALAAVSGDFGRMVTRRPTMVVTPAVPEDVATTVRFAAEHGLTVHTRGEAHTQSGQVLSEGGIVLRMGALNKMLAVDPAGPTVTCEAGLLWRDLVEQLSPRRFIPPVLTNNLGVSIGGTLSVAGLGISSFRFGAQGDNCLALQVVTGTGELLRCSRAENAELFDHVRSGLGQFGIIVEATLTLRTHLSHTRTFHLLYDEIGTLMEDAQPAMDQERFGFLEAWCVPCPQGFRKVAGVKEPFAAWFFPLQATVEYDPARPPDDDALLAGLHYYKHVHTEDQEIYEFANRLEPLFALWRASGYWDSAHPWMETILPWASGKIYIEQVLSRLPPPAIAGGHILLWPSKGGVSHLPMFRTPDQARHVMGFGILPGYPSHVLERALPRLKMASDLSMQAGGKRYLSGMVNFDLAQWKAHYGPDLWARMQELKRRYDPKGILNPGFIPYE